MFSSKAGGIRYGSELEIKEDRFGFSYALLYDNGLSGRSCPYSYYLIGVAYCTDQ